MARWKTDRTAIFLCLLFVLFLWDLVYFLGLRNPDRFPHPFIVFRMVGDLEFLHGFPSMLRYLIFTVVLGGLIGVAAGRLILRSGRLTQTAVQVLRLGLWLPLLIVFATPDPWTLAIAAAAFYSCYHYLVATSVLGLEGPEIRSFVARETTLQILFFSLISQIWLLYWKWFSFAVTYQALEGLRVLITIVVLLMFIQWIFRSDFKVVAEWRGSVLYEDLKIPNWKWVCGFFLFALVFTVIWERVEYIRFPRWSTSPLDVISAGYQLLKHGEIYTDIQVSLLELLGGILLGGSIALLVFALMSANGIIRNALTSLLPLSNISPMILWLASFLIMGRIVPDFLGYWHKVFAVACFIFFPFVQALWGLRDSAIPLRILMATDHALPFAFIAMLFGELWASTAGLGFVMTVASVTYQFDKGLAGFLMVVLLLVVLSTTLRCVAKWFFSVKEPNPIITVSAT